MGDNVFRPECFPPIPDVVDRELKLHIPGRPMEGEEVSVLDT